MICFIGLGWTRVSARAASSSYRDEHATMVRNVLLSQKGDISPAIVTTTERERDDKVGDTPGARRDKHSVLNVSLALKRSRVREGNTSLAVAAN